MKTRSGLPVLLVTVGAVVVALLVPMPRAYSAPYNIQGVVTDATTGQPIVGALVTLAEPADGNGNGYFDTTVATTDSNGLYQFSGVATAMLHWDRYVAAAGYEPTFLTEAHAVHRIGVPATALPVALTPDSNYALVVVSTRHAVSGLPAPGVILSCDPARTDRRGVSGSTGSATIAVDASNCELPLFAHGVGFVTAETTITLTPPSPYAATLDVECGVAELTGTIKNHNGQPISGAPLLVRFIASQTSSHVLATTGSSGAYCVRGIPPNTYTVVVGRDDAVYLQDVTITGMITSPLDITLSETSGQTYSVSGTVTDGAGYSQEDVRVTLDRLCGDVACGGPSHFTDVNGDYSFPGCIPGTYALYWTEGGASEINGPEVIELDGDLQDLSLVLKPVMEDDPSAWPASMDGEFSISGEVVGTGGHSLQGVRVSLCVAGDPGVQRSSETDGDGLFSLTGHASGSYELSVMGSSAQGDPWLQLDGVLRVDVDSASVTGCTLVLHSAHALVLQVVARDESGDLCAVSGSTVFLKDHQGTTLATSSTDDSGRVTFSGLSSAATYTMSVSEEGYEHLDVEASPGSGMELVEGFWLYQKAVILTEVEE